RVVRTKTLPKSDLAILTTFRPCHSDAWSIRATSSELTPKTLRRKLPLASAKGFFTLKITP
ncbi:MAG: hypothetical protein Q8J74_06875, partial [Candidatus Didemnitutus sp.]|nr:hypothetical protein [Candidatus Didemnitutus sp.]